MTDEDKKLAYWVTNDCDKCQAGGGKRLKDVATIIAKHLLPERTKNIENVKKITILLDQINLERTAAGGMAGTLLAMYKHISFVGDGADELRELCNTRVAEWRKTMEGMV